MNRLFTGRALAFAAASGFVLLTSAPAFAQDVKYNYAMGTNFAKYKTYKWVDVPNENHPDQITDQQIKGAIESDLATKGLTKATGADADLNIAYQIAMSQERQWNAYGGMGGLRFGGFGGGMGTATSSTIHVGTLIFDVYDPVAKQQIWTGDATKTLDPSSDPKKNEERLQKSVKKLLKHYPPQDK